MLTTAIIAEITKISLTHFWLQYYYGWAFFWRDAALGTVAALTATTVVTAFTCNAKQSTITLFAIPLASTLGSHGIGVIIGLILVMAFSFSEFLSDSKTKTFLGQTNSIIKTPFTTLGIFVRGTAIRLFATLTNLGSGIKQLPNNWIETTLTIDFTHPPELLLQASEIDFSLGARTLWTNRHLFGAIAKPILFIFLLFLYSTAIAWRWSLKASAWLWWPLALALTPPQANRRLAATIPAWHPQIVVLATVTMLWLLSTSPAIAIWLGLLPKELLTIAHSLPPPPPTISLRAMLAYLGFALTALLIYRAKNFNASDGDVMASQEKFNALNATDRAEFLNIAKGIDRIRLVLIAVIVLWGEAMALGFLHARYPQTVERFVLPALLQYL